MLVTFEVDNQLPAFTLRQIEAGAKAVTAGVSQVAAAIKANWRDQIKSAGLGPRLARSVRHKVYPQSGVSASAAAMIWAKAPKIVAAHDQGATITAKNGFWLAVPLPAAGKSTRGGRISPAEWEARTGRRLRFVYRGGRTALLVDDGTKSGNRIMGRDGFSKAARGFRNRTVPIFFLTPRVKLKKKMDLQGGARGLGLQLPAAIRANWRVAK